MQHFISTLNISRLTPTIVRLVINAGIVNSIPDLFTLNTRKLRLVGIKLTDAQLIVSQIKWVSGLEFNQILPAICPIINQEQANALCLRFGSFQQMQDGQPSELEKVQGFSPDKIREFAQWINAPATKYLLNNIKKFVATSRPIPETPKPLSGITFCLTGKMPKPRKQIIDYITSHGAVTTSALSVSVNYILAGDKPGDNKINLAAKHGIPVITFSELDKILLNQASENELQQLAEMQPAKKQFTLSTVKFNIPMQTAYNQARNHNINITRPSVNARTISLAYESIDHLIDFAYNCGKEINI